MILRHVLICIFNIIFGTVMIPTGLKILRPFKKKEEESYNEEI